MIQRVDDGTPQGRWIVKKKFTFAGVALIIGSIFAAKGIYIATTPEQIVVVISSYSTYCGWLLGLIFAADVADKKLNGGGYQQS